MKVRVSPSRLHGTVAPPPSKSLMQRAVVAALLSSGPVKILNPSFCKDAKSALGAAAALGAKVEITDACVTITRMLRHPTGPINVGESGLSLRLFTAIAGLLDTEVRIEGAGSLQLRPTEFMRPALTALGAGFTTTDGHVPVIIRGPLHGGAVSVDGSLTGQFVSGLLLAAPLMPDGLELTVTNLNSQPYVDMTLEVMAHFGIVVTRSGYEHFSVKPGQLYKATDITIEGDCSGGAALLAAGALCGSPGYAVGALEGTFTQADRTILNLLTQTGNQPVNAGQSFHLKAAPVRAFAFDATQSPDLFPVLAAMAAFADGPCHLTGALRLQHKESNRASALQTEFSKVGIRVDVHGDIMIITPGIITSAELSACNDHRIAMACALLGMAGVPITLSGAECVEKSFPNFWQVLKSAGANIDSIAD